MKPPLPATLPPWWHPIPYPQYPSHTAPRPRSRSWCLVVLVLVLVLVVLVVLVVVAVVVVAAVPGKGRQGAWRRSGDNIDRGRGKGGRR